MTRRTLEVAYAGGVHTVHFNDPHETVEELEESIGERGYLRIDGNYVKDGEAEVGPWTFMPEEIVRIL